MPGIASKTILDELVIEAKRNARGGCTVYAVLPVGREVFIADVDVMGPKRALIEAQRNPLVVRELVKLTTEAKKIRAQNERLQQIADAYGDDPEVALYLADDDADLLAAAAELGIDLSDDPMIGGRTEAEWIAEAKANDDALAKALDAQNADENGVEFDFPTVIESNPYVTA